MTPDAKRAHELYIYDPVTGALTRRVTRGGHRAGTVAGAFNSSTGYLYMNLNCARYGVHRVIWLMVHGEWPKEEIDHIDGDRLNNRLANLRDVSSRVNRQNFRRAKSQNKAGVLGVNVRPNGRFIARIGVDGEQQYLGSYGTAGEAHKAYVEAKRRLHEGCTL